MGRKKLEIHKIQDPQRRNITYAKRKKGLIRKAQQLIILCDVPLIVFGRSRSSGETFSEGGIAALQQYIDLSQEQKERGNQDMKKDTRKWIFKAENQENAKIQTFEDLLVENKELKALLPKMREDQDNLMGKGRLFPDDQDMSWFDSIDHCEESIKQLQEASARVDSWKKCLEQELAMQAPSLNPTTSNEEPQVIQETSTDDPMDVPGQNGLFEDEDEEEPSSPAIQTNSTDEAMDVRGQDGRCENEWSLPTTKENSPCDPMGVPWQDEACEDEDEEREEVDGSNTSCANQKRDGLCSASPRILDSAGQKILDTLMSISRAAAKVDGPCQDVEREVVAESTNGAEVMKPVTLDLLAKLDHVPAGVPAKAVSTMQLEN